MSEYFGFELLFTSVKGQLKEDHDLLVVAFHWLLIREHFLCIGIGVERELSDTETPSELLPSGWNENNECYYLRYFNPEQKRVLVLDLTISSPEEAIVTIAGDEAVNKGFSMKIQDYLKDFSVANNTKTKIQQIIPKIDELMYKFKSTFKDLISGEAQKASASTTEEPEAKKARNPVAATPPTVPDLPEYPIGHLHDPLLRDIGRGDLDPFGRGGGMLGVGPGQIFPRLRYDPVGPGPINDHFPPPGGPGFDPDPGSYMFRNPQGNRRGGPGLPPPPGPGNLDWYS